MGFSLQLCDVIVWLGKQTNSNLLMAEEKNEYVNREVHILKDKKGNYYYKKCIFPNLDIIAEAYINNAKVFITSIFENKGRAREIYPLRAKIRYSKE
jgi:hypothetical protein